MGFRLQLRPYRTPFRAPLRTAHGVWNDRQGVLLRVETEEGAVGFGEVAPLPWFGTETVAEAQRVLSALPAPFEETAALGALRPFPCCAFAVAAACEEASRRERAVVQKRLPLAALLPAGPAALDRLRLLAAAGFKTYKWKVGVLAGREERALLPRLAEALPSSGALRLDANGAWSPAEALAWIDAAVGLPVEFLEQPLPPSAISDLLRLAGDSATPLALDESVASRDDVKGWSERGWPGIYVLKPAIMGSPAETLALLEKVRIEAVFSSALETPIGAAAAVRMAFSYSGSKRALGFGTGAWFADERVAFAAGLTELTPEILPTFDRAALWNHFAP